MSGRLKNFGCLSNIATASILVWSLYFTAAVVYAQLASTFSFSIAAMAAADPLCA